MKKRQIDLQFPFGGLNRATAYQQQPPYTSPDLLNVRSVDIYDNRERGCTRPGLIESHIDNLGDSVRLLTVMTTNPGDGFTVWSDTFGGTELASDIWTQASWASSMPLILPPAMASVDTSIDEGEAVLESLPIDSSEDYSVEIFLVPWEGSYHGEYRLYLRLDDTTPDIETEGVKIELTITASTGAYTATLNSVLDEEETVIDTASGTISTRAGWLTAEVSGDAVTVYWCGTEILSGTVDTQTGLRTGFGMKCENDGGLCLANVFRVQYYSTETVDNLRSLLIACADGKLYKEGPYGRLTEIESDLTFRDDVQLTAAQTGQELIIADYGDVVANDTASVNGTALTVTGITDWDSVGLLDDDMVATTSP
jgi:hypothetical protein